MLLQRRFLRAELQDIVHQALRSHVFLVRRHRTAHHVLHHILHQRHPIIVLLRAGLLQVELLQRGQREMEVNLHFNPCIRQKRGSLWGSEGIPRSSTCPWRGGASKLRG